MLFASHRPTESPAKAANYSAELAEDFDVNYMTDNETHSLLWLTLDLQLQDENQISITLEPDEVLELFHALGEILLKHRPREPQPQPAADA